MSPTPKAPNPQIPISRLPNTHKGVTLIIVVFAMMLFGVLGWTLARMQAVDFESNLRTFEPENVLNLAEAGAQYALNVLSQNSCMRTVAGAINLSGCTSNNQNMDTDCADTSDWLTAPHSLSPGQYNVCVRNPCPTCTPAESGDVVIESRGYIPAQSGSRTMRQIKLEVDLGSLTNAVQTQVPSDTDLQQGLFDWSQTITDITPQPHTIQIEGNIEAGHYNGDGDATYDEAGLGQDYKSQPPPILPDDRQNPESETRTFTATYPAIDMLYFYNAATNRWPTAGRILNTTVTIIAGGNRLQASAGFFNAANDPNSVAVKRQNGSLNNNNDWTIITGVTGGGSIAIVSPNVAAWPDEDSLTPGIQVAIKLVKYFYQDGSSERWYIGRKIITANDNDKADTLIYLASDVALTNFSIVTEGDIVIKGPNRIRMDLSGSVTRYPNLASQNGSIISLDLPNAANETGRRNQRRFEGLIYSQNGLVTFDYLRGALIYGNKVTFNGTIRVDYSSGNISSGGFIFKPATLKWKEE